MLIQTSRPIQTHTPTHSKMSDCILCLLLAAAVESVTTNCFQETTHLHAPNRHRSSVCMCSRNRRHRNRPILILLWRRHRPLIRAICHCGSHILLHLVWYLRKTPPAHLLTSVHCLVLVRTCRPIQPWILAKRRCTCHFAIRLRTSSFVDLAIPRTHRVRTLALAKLLATEQLALWLTAHGVTRRAAPFRALWRADHCTLRVLTFCVALRKHRLLAEGHALRGFA